MECHWYRSIFVLPKAHINENGLHILVKKYVLQGLNNVDLEKYSHYMVDKQVKVFFKSHPPLRKSNLLQLVHSDICDPLKIKSFRDTLHFFIDECSRKLWVYALTIKDQVLYKFKEILDLVVRKISKKMKYVRTNDDGE